MRTRVLKPKHCETCCKGGLYAAMFKKKNRILVSVTIVAAGFATILTIARGATLCSNRCNVFLNGVAKLDVRNIQRVTSPLLIVI